MLACLGYLLLRYGVEIISGSVEKAFSLFLTPMILCVALSDSIYARVLRFKPLLFLGRISTSVYFWHMPVYGIFTQLIIGGPITEVQYLIYAVILLLCSVVSFRFLESPGKPKVQVKKGTPR